MFRRLKVSSCQQIISRHFHISELSKDHIILQETCRNFVEKELKPIAGTLDKECKFPKKQIQDLAEMGLMRVTVSPDYGGSGLDMLALSIVVEEISRGCGSTGSIVSIHNCLYANLIDRLGSVEQKENFLKKYSKDTVGAFALSETNAGSDVVALKTTATKENGSWILHGSKSWVTSGIEAKAGVIFATIDSALKYKGITAFLLDFDTPGLEKGRNEDKMGIKATSTCSLFLNNVKVPDQNVLGYVGGGFKIAMEQLNRARIGIASQALGIAQSALETAVSYASQRIAFGEPIIKMPSVRSRIAEMAVKIEAARLLTRKAAFEIDRKQNGAKSCSMAKLAASECATFAAHNCQQILGGMGYVTDYPAERYYRDARITEIYGGVTDVQKSVIADQIIKEYNF